MSIKLAFALFVASIAVVPNAAVQTATAQESLTAAFCANLSLGGPRTFPFDSNGDGVADVCSLPYTRREAIARQNALERLARQYPSTFLTFVKQECRLLTSQDFGDSPDDLAKDVCATGILTPAPTVENQPPQFYSGVVSGPSFCANLSLGGPKTYPFDSNGDGVAEVCSLPYTRREAIARQNALLKLAQRFVADSNLWLVEACAALRAQNADFGDNPADLAKDICQPSSRPGGGPGGGGPGGGGPGPQRQTTVPGAPTSLRITVGNTELSVVWTAPASGGAAITGYTVQIRTGNNQFAAPSAGTCAASLDGSTTSCSITGLTNGTTYDIRVGATNSVGDSNWALGSATPDTEPDQPTAPRLTAGDTQIAVTWSAPNNSGSAITDYDVQYCNTDAANASCNDANGTTWTNWSHSGTVVSATITSLTNGDAYKVRVRATNNAGTSLWSPSATATPVGKPDAPAAPTLRHNYRAPRLDVSWMPPNDNGASIIDYDVRYCTNSTGCDTASEWTALDDNGNNSTSTATSIGIEGLTYGTVYQVQVLAGNRLGDGPWSASSTEYPSTIPDWTRDYAPTLTVGDQSLGVSWSAPSDNGGSAITGYKVGRCSGSVSFCRNDENWTNTTLTGTGTTTTLSSLTNGTAYRVRVAAINRSGEAWSDSATATPAKAPSTPAAPTLTRGAEQVTVTWTAPANNGSAITDYDVRYQACTATPKSCTSSPTWGSWLSLTGNADPGTATTATITGLTNGTAYQAQVRAANDWNGDSSDDYTGWSPSSASAIPADKPDAPAAPTVNVGSSTLAVSWTAPAANGSAITDYDVQYRKQNSDNTWPSTWTSHSHSGTATTATITGLTNESDYQVQVRATNSVNPSTWSPSTTATPSAKPPVSTVSANATKQNHFAVLTMETTYVTAIQGWQWQWKTNVPGWSSLKSVTTTAKTYSTGQLTTQNGGPGSLIDGISYGFRVRACSGTCPASASATNSTSSDWVLAFYPPVSPPSQPNTVQSAPKDQSLDVTWSAPSSNGGSAITDYDVRYRQLSSGSWGTETSWTHTGTTTTATITGLTNGAVYQVRVQAKNVAGGSPWSPYSASRAAGKPNAPTVAVTVANKALVVSWTTTGSAYAAITGYDVQYCINSTGCDAANEWSDWAHSGTATTATISNLTNSTSYQVQVRASNSAGDGDWSTAVSGTPAVVAPSAPAAPTVQTDYQALVVSWTAPNNNGAAITDYDVQYRRCVSDDKTCTYVPSWTNWLNRSGETASDTATTVRIASLANATAYQVRVRAANSQGESSWSPLSKGTPGSAAPGVPTGLTLTSGNKALTATWTPPLLIGAATVGYDVRYRRCKHNLDPSCTTLNNVPAWQTQTTEVTNDTTATTTTIGGLTNGYAYQVEVRADNSFSTSDWTTAALIPGTPSQPAKPTLSYASNVLTVTWTVPNNNGSSITGYTVRYRACTNTSDLTCQTNPQWGSWTYGNATTGATTTTISSLTNGTAYEARLFARNANGRSKWSEPTNSLKRPATPTVSSPASLVQGNLNVTWTAPANYGFAITDYDVQYCINSTGCDAANEWSDWAHSGTATTATITGLTSGTEYVVRIRATSTGGTGDWSDKSTVARVI